MQLEKPSLAQYLNDPKLQGYEVLQKIFFAPTESSQAAGEAFIGRLGQQYFCWKQGRIRWMREDEGRSDEAERLIQKLLAENGT